jgi:hypothetical protein
MAIRHLTLLMVIHHQFRNMKVPNNQLLMVIVPSDELQ